MKIEGKAKWIGFAVCTIFGSVLLGILWLIVVHYINKE